MQDHEDSQNRRSGREPEDVEKKQPASGTNKETLADEVPSTEEEIEPGVNQDASSGESFSSEPAQEAAGEDSGT